MCHSTQETVKSNYLQMSEGLYCLYSPSFSVLPSHSPDKLNSSILGPVTNKISKDALTRFVLSLCLHVTYQEWLNRVL
jgi:hypothetical protein